MLNLIATRCAATSRFTFHKINLWHPKHCEGGKRNRRTSDPEFKLNSETRRIPVSDKPDKKNNRTKKQKTVEFIFELSIQILAIRKLVFFFIYSIRYILYILIISLDISSIY